MTYAQTAWPVSVWGVALLVSRRAPNRYSENRRGPIPEGNEFVQMANAKMLRGAARFWEMLS